MELSLEQFVCLSEDEKIKILKENNIKFDPFLWMLLNDCLKNSIYLIYLVVTERVTSDPPETITYEDGKNILEKCDQLKKSLTKLQNELVQTKED